MTEISRRLASEPPQALDSALRERILSSVTYAENVEAQVAKPHYRRSGQSLLLLGGATAAGLLVIVMMNVPRGGHSPGDTLELKSAPSTSRSESQFENKAAAPSAGPGASNAYSPAPEPAAGGASSPSAERGAADGGSVPDRQFQSKMKSELQVAAPSAAAEASPADSVSKPQADAPEQSRRRGSEGSPPASVSKPQGELGGRADRAFGKPATVLPPFVESPADREKTQDRTIEQSPSDVKPSFSGALPAKADIAPSAMRSTARAKAASAVKLGKARKARAGRPAHARIRAFQPARAKREAETRRAAAKPKR